MVNVTKSNFIEQSNDLLQHLPTAAFVAIDEEMTGIQLPRQKRPPQHHTPSQRYQSNKAVPERYSIVQLGVVLFHRHPDYDPNSDVGPDFLVRRYNFYGFPPSDGRLTREVTMNPSTVAFLAEHNMSFNLWAKQGVSYVTTEKVEGLVEKYREDRRKEAEENVIKPHNPHRRRVELTKREDINFVARTMASVREWLDSARNQRRDSAIHSDEGSALLLPSCNSFLRRALYESIELEYPALVVEKVGKDQLQVLRMDAEEREIRAIRLREEGWEALIKQVGLWRVFRAISNACRGYREVDSLVLAENADQVDLDAKPRLERLRRNVPIVVHNGYMDLLFLMTHFYKHKLPESYDQMKAMVAHHFPVVYDTKSLATEFCGPAMAAERSTLSNLYPKLVTQNPSNALSRYLVSGGGDEFEQDHEASYDAFMTGCVFVGMIRQISEGNESDFKEITGLDDVVGLPPLLEPLENTEAKSLYGRNMLHLMQTIYTIDLEDPDSDPLSSNMSPTSSFHISGINSSVNTRDIVLSVASLTSPNDPHPIQTSVIWVDDTTFLLCNKERYDAETTRNHGRLIRRALETKFAGSTIVSVEERFSNIKQAEKAKDTMSWTTRLTTAVMDMLYRKRSVQTMLEEVEVEHPRAKRRRLE